MSRQTKQPLILLGAGGHAHVVLDAARASGLDIEGFYDDNPGAQLSDLQHLGPLSDTPAQCFAIVCVGDLPTRKRLLASLCLAPATVVHPSAIVARDVALGQGVFAGPRVIINTGAKIADHAILNSGCIVEHDTNVGTNAHIAPGVVLAGNVTVGRNTLVGLGARVLPGISVGNDATIASGAVVTRDVDSGATVAGVPAVQLSS